jgi:hypothetical protein
LLLMLQLGEIGKRHGSTYVILGRRKPGEQQSATKVRAVSFRKSS